MQIPELTVVDILQLTADKQVYTNFPVARVNNHVVRVSVMTEPYFWHLHPNSDETFLVMEGTLLLDFETETIALHPGQLFTIPKNVKHRTRPQGERSVNLTFEDIHLETILL